MVELKNETIESPSKKANVEGVKTESSSLQVESTLPERNLVLQNLLRAPRYFDLPKWSSSCSSSDEEYPAFTKRRTKQTICHYCGDNHVVTTNCEQIRRMFVISSEGNLVKRPDNDSDVHDDTSVLCLKCGDTGHEMFSCRNGYDSSDLEEVRCYVCDKNGHLCCANYRTDHDVAISCYSCGQSGHIGSECPKLKEVALCSNSELRDQSLEELHEENPIRDAAAPHKSGKTARKARNRKNKKAATRLSMLNNRSSIETNTFDATQASPPINVGSRDSRNGQPVIYQAQLPPHFLDLWRACPQSSSGPHHLMRVAEALRNAPMSHHPPPPPMIPPTDSSTHVILPHADSPLQQFFNPPRPNR